MVLYVNECWLLIHQCHIIPLSGVPRVERAINTMSAPQETLRCPDESVRKTIVEEENIKINTSPWRLWMKEIHICSLTEHNERELRIHAFQHKRRRRKINECF